MTTEGNEAVVRQLFDAFDHGDLNAIVELFADDVVNHTAPPGLPQGRDGVRPSAAALLTAFPDVRTTVDLFVSEDDVVTAVHTHEGTHAGPYGSIPPTGKRFRINGIEVFRIVDSKIAEYWRRDDELGTLAQLGVIHVPGQ